jgi:hypothetical protein
MIVRSAVRVLMVDIGSNGPVSDAQIFNKCDLQESTMDGSIEFPPLEPIMEGYQGVHVYMFALRTWVMMPYSAKGLTRDQRIFYYRLSRVWRKMLLAHPEKSNYCFFI